MAVPRKVVLYGAGGHARELAWLLSDLAADFRLVGFVEDGTAPGRMIGGVPVLSWADFEVVPRDTLVCVAVGDPRDRRAMAGKCAAAGFGFATLVHPSVRMSASVRLGAGAVVCAGCVVTVDVEVGPHAHVNVGCTVSHDARIGEFATLAPGVHISGRVHIGRDTYVGTGANIINGAPGQPLVVGDGCVVAAGACVTRSTESAGLYAGVPAELKKRY